MIVEEKIKTLAAVNFGSAAVANAIFVAVGILVQITLVACITPQFPNDPGAITKKSFIDATQSFFLIQSIFGSYSLFASLPVAIKGEQHSTEKEVAIANCIFSAISTIYAVAMSCFCDLAGQGLINFDDFANAMAGIAYAPLFILIFAPCCCACLEA